MRLETKTGTEEIKLEVYTEFLTDSLRIRMYHMNEGEWQEYGYLTLVIPLWTPDYCAYVDTANYPELTDFLKKYDLGDFNGAHLNTEGHQYPMYIFNADKLRELCPAEMEYYERKIGMIKEPPEPSKSR